MKQQLWAIKIKKCLMDWEYPVQNILKASGHMTEGNLSDKTVFNK